MVHNLPDELLREIIQPSLVVSDAMFSDGGSVSPFSKVDKSAADFLLVCKRWMRISTPWLYETVILRSMAQARSLAGALESSPDFGRYIKKLRVEGCYDDYILTVVDSAPNITDLCMTLAVWSDVSVDGMYEALEKMSPRRVILTLNPKQKLRSRNHDVLCQQLSAQIPLWKNLVEFRFSLSFEGLSRTLPDFAVYPSILDAVAASTSIKEVHMNGLCYHQQPIRAAVNTLASSTSIKSVVFRAYFYNVGVFRRDFPISQCRKLDITIIDYATQKRYCLGQPDAPVLQSAPNPFWQPLGGASKQTRETIWYNVIKHAVTQTTEIPLHMHHFHGSGWHDSVFNSHIARKMRQVSFEWRTIVYRVLCQHISIRTSGELHALLDILAYDPSLATHIRSLRIYSYFPRTEELLKYATSVKLVVLCPRTSSWTTLAEHAGDSIEEICVMRPRTGVAPEWDMPLDRFSRLHRLRVEFESHPSLGDDEEGEEVHTLEADPSGSTSRKIAHCQCLEFAGDTTVSLRVFQRFSFPYLVCVKLEGHNPDQKIDFLRAHSSSIRELETVVVSAELLAALPELETISLGQRHWRCSPPYDDFAEPEMKHDRLRCLRLQILHADENQRSMKAKSNNKLWSMLLCEAITKEKFPSLEIVQLTYPGKLWPATERDTKKSIWPGISDALAKRGITLQDHEGLAWRRRMS